MIKIYRKHKTLKIVTMLTLSILMFAFMAVFPLVNNASAEEEINTTDEFILRDIQEDDFIGSRDIYIDLSKFDIPEGPPVQIMLFTVKDALHSPNEAFWVRLHIDPVNINHDYLYTVELRGVNSWDSVSMILYEDDTFDDLVIIQFPYDNESTVRVQDVGDSDYPDYVVQILVSNPDYLSEVDPTPEPTSEPDPTEEPTTPLDDVNAFFTAEGIFGLSIGAIIILILLLKKR